MMLNEAYIRIVHMLKVTRKLDVICSHHTYVLYTEVPPRSLRFGVALFLCSRVLIATRLLPMRLNILAS